MGNQIGQSYVVASKTQRFVNYFLDVIFIIVLSFALGFVLGLLALELHLTGARFLQFLQNPVGRFLTGFVIHLLYFLVCESLWQRTAGKFVTGTIVVTRNGDRPAFGDIAVRTLSRFCPFEPFSFLTSRSGGWHDWWSGTVVVRVAAAGARANLGVPYASVVSGEPMGQGTVATEPIGTAVAAGIPDTGSSRRAQWVVLAILAVICAGAFAYKLCRPIVTAKGFSQFGPADCAYDLEAAPTARPVDTP